LLDGCSFAHGEFIVGHPIDFRQRHGGYLSLGELPNVLCRLY
jgi:hypothetical protein